jgi:hypothetical protein
MRNLSLVLCSSWVSDDARPNRKHEKWLNALLKRGGGPLSAPAYKGANIISLAGASDESLIGGDAVRTLYQTLQILRLLELNRNLYVLNKAASKKTCRWGSWVYSRAASSRQADR